MTIVNNEKLMTPYINRITYNVYIRYYNKSKNNTNPFINDIKETCSYYTNGDIISNSYIYTYDGNKIIR